MIISDDMMVKLVAKEIIAELNLNEESENLDELVTNYIAQQESLL